MVQKPPLQVALVHDFLREYGGAERVLEALHDMYPDAPVYTAFVDWDGLGPHAARLQHWNIKESWVRSIWPVKKLISPFRFLAPLIWGSFDFSAYDIVISSSSWFITKGIHTKKPTVHICYLHTPPRYLYGYQTAREWRKYWPIRFYAGIVNHFLRIYDFESSQRVNHFIANSKETQRRIQKFYRRESTVIYPPVQVSDARSRNSRLNLEQGLTLPEDYFLVVSRLARAKHIDIAIEVCQELGENLVIVGKGADEDRLRRVSAGSKRIHFTGEVPDEVLPSLYTNAKALIFPAEDEEFGIVPVESMGYGTPVVAYRSGGVVETVVEGKTGIFFDELSASSLGKALKDFDTLNHRSRRALKKECMQRAREFSRKRFEKEIRSFVDRAEGPATRE